MKIKRPTLKIPQKKWIILGVLAVAVIGGGVWGYNAFSHKPVTATTITGKVQSGDVRKVITATGTVSFPQLVNLTFEQTEKLVALNVKVGDHVKTGQVLMQIDSSNLQQSVNQQQANLASAQAKLQQVGEESLPNAVAALAQAQDALNTKQTAFNTAKNNADPAYLANQVNLASQNVNSASNTLAQAMANGDATKIQSAQTALNQAQQALTTAQTAQNGGAAAALQVAQSNYEVAQQTVNLAQEKVDKLRQGQSSADILTAQTAVQQAQTQLQTAQTNLAKATMTAPFDGVITAVSGQVGQVMESTTNASAKPGATLAANPDVLEVDTTVGQADVNSIKVGQKAEITLDTQPDVKIPGTVTTIDVQGKTTSNVTTFGVTLTVDQAGTILKAGMNANVNIILDQVNNVLTVPSEALKTNNGKNFILVPNVPGESTSRTDTGSASNSGTKRSGAAGSAAGMGNMHPVPVEIGLNDGTNVEIKSGLTEGQEIIVSVSVPTNSGTSSTQRSGNNGSLGAGMGALNRATNPGGGGRPSGTSQNRAGGH